MPSPDSRIHVFISWSGSRSQKVALALRDWLPTVVNECKPWVSKEDIELGKAWAPEIQGALARATVGIICVTPENAGSTWLNFEAGAISKQISDDQFVIPLAIGFKDPSDVKPPLGRFQAALANEDGARRVHEMLNRRRTEPLPAATIADVFEGMWPKLQKAFDEAAKSKPPVKREEPDKISEILSIVRGIAERVTEKRRAATPVTRRVVEHEDIAQDLFPLTCDHEAVHAQTIRLLSPKELNALVRKYGLKPSNPGGSRRKKNDSK